MIAPATPSPNNVPRVLLRPSEAAAALGISQRTLMGMVADGECP